MVQKSAQQFFAKFTLFPIIFQGNTVDCSRHVKIDALGNRYSKVGGAGVRTTGMSGSSVYFFLVFKGFKIFEGNLLPRCCRGTCAP